MSKSTRMTKAQLSALGLEETSPGVYSPVKKKDPKFDPRTGLEYKTPATRDLYLESEDHFNHEKRQAEIVSSTIEGFSDIHLVVSGEPTPQQRHRHHRVKNSDFVTTYDPSSKIKKEFLKKCLPHKPESPLDCPLRVVMEFYFKRPKSHYRTGKFSHILKPDAPTNHITRPDSDNLAKMVKDALNKVFWKDDSLVCDLHIKKIYSESPRTEVFIWRM